MSEHTDRTEQSHAQESEYESMGMTRLARRNVVIFTIITLCLTNMWTARQWMSEQTSHDVTRSKLLECKDQIRTEANRISEEYIKFIKEKKWN